MFTLKPCSCFSICKPVAALLVGVALSAHAEPDLIDIASPRHLIWESDPAASLYEIQATPKLAPTSGWITVGTVAPTGLVMSTWLNITNDVAFYRVIADTSAFPVTRHEMNLVPEETFLMGGERTNWYTFIDLVDTNNGMVVTTLVFSAAAFSRELPQHPVPVSSFLIDRYEVTQDKFAEVMQWAYTNSLVDVLPSVFTNFFLDENTNIVAVVTTSDVSRVVNLEGLPQTLYRVDHAWSELRFGTNQFYRVDPLRSNFPALGVTWFGALAYANYRSDMEGLERAIDFSVTNWAMDRTQNGYRLPTEAEWEKASRGGESNLFPWPDDSVQGTNNYNYSIDHFKANYQDRRFGGVFTNQPLHPWSNYELDGNRIASTPVGYYDGAQSIETAHTSLPFDSGADAWTTNDMANGFGLYDMSGNAWEWCWDWFGTNWYSQAAAQEPDNEGETDLNQVGPTGNFFAKIMRGGGWLDIPTGFPQRAPDPSFQRSAYREAAFPSSTFRPVGFRTVRPLE